MRSPSIQSATILRHKRSRLGRRITCPNRDKTVTEPLVLKWLGLALSEKQIPQVVENLESGGKPKEGLETAALRPRQVRYQAALRPDLLLARPESQLCQNGESS